MKAITHLTFGALCGVTATGFGYECGTLEASMLAVGSLLPDIDRRTSAVGRLAGPISVFLERKIGHRTLTHSLLGILIFGLLSSPLILASPNAWGWFLLGFSSHIFLDTWNKEGVPLLWPNRIDFVIYYNRKWRVGYGSQQEFYVLGVLSILALVLVPLSLQGFEPWFHKLMGTPNAAIQDFSRWRDHYEVHVSLEGENFSLREKIKDRFRVIDALDPDRIIIEDGAGRAFTIGTKGEVDIHSHVVRAVQGNEIDVTQFYAELAGQTVASLYELTPETALRTYINAEFETVGFVSTPSRLGEFSRVQQRGSRLVLRSARPQDLNAILHLSIVSGTALIRSEFAKGEAVAVKHQRRENVEGLEMPIRIRSIEGLAVAVGDQVLEGQTLARDVDEFELGELESERSKNVQELAFLEQKLSSAEEINRLETAKLQARLKSLREEEESLAYLVSKNARPRAELEKLQSERRTVEEEMKLSAARWVSQKLEMGNQRSGLRVAIEALERRLQNAKEEQLIFAPFDGIVSQIKLKGVTADGVDLSLLLLKYSK